MKKQCGIYKIINKLNGKIYIGSSLDIISRWSDHKHLLNTNKHHSIHLQRAWNKHGRNHFDFKILEICNVEDLLKKEQYYLNTLLKANLFLEQNDNYFLKQGYNIKPTAGSNLGFKHSEETKLKIKANFLNVYAINNNGDILKEFQSTGDAAKFYNIAVSRIQLSTKNKKCIKNSKIGFIYVKDWFEGYKPIIVKAWQKGTKGVLKNKNKKEVYVYNLRGNFIEKINSQLECCNKYNINPCNLVRSLNEDIRINRFFNRKRKFLFRRTNNDINIIKLQQQQIN